MPEPPSAAFTAYIGALIAEKTAGDGRLTLTTGPQHTDLGGHVHPGVLTSVMDSVIGIALGQLRGEGAREKHGPHATIEMSTSFYSQAAPGDQLVFEGRIVRLAERFAFGEAETRRAADNEVIARAHLTFAIPGARPDAERSA